MNVVKDFCLVLVFISKSQFIHSVDVYSFPGGTDDYLKFIKHPGFDDFDALSVCMRHKMHTMFIYLDLSFLGGIQLRFPE